MEESIKEIFKDSLTLKEVFLKRCLEQIVLLAKMAIETMQHGKKILLFGNGGSAADAQHIAAEFVNRFKKKRRSLPALALTTDTSVITSISNDYGFSFIFVKQIEALGQRDDMALGISTSGHSSNVNLALKKAKEMGLKTVALSGGDGGEMVKIVDLSIIVPSFNIPRIQEIHIMVGHIICELVERSLFD
jgi:D-sedoheptulose 7-phosphate isomerase